MSSFVHSLAGLLNTARSADQPSSKPDPTKLEKATSDLGNATLAIYESTYYSPPASPTAIATESELKFAAEQARMRLEDQALVIKCSTSADATLEALTRGRMLAQQAKLEVEEFVKKDSNSKNGSADATNAALTETLRADEMVKKIASEASSELESIKKNADVEANFNRVNSVALTRQAVEHADEMTIKSRLEAQALTIPNSNSESSIDALKDASEEKSRSEEKVRKTTSNANNELEAFLESEKAKAAKLKEELEKSQAETKKLDEEVQKRAQEIFKKTNQDLEVPFPIPPASPTPSPTPARAPTPPSSPASVPTPKSAPTPPSSPAPVPTPKPAPTPPSSPAPVPTPKPAATLAPLNPTQPNNLESKDKVESDDEGVLDDENFGEMKSPNKEIPSSPRSYKWLGVGIGLTLTAALLIGTVFAALLCPPAVPVIGFVAVTYGSIAATSSAAAIASVVAVASLGLITLSAAALSFIKFAKSKI